MNSSSLAQYAVLGNPIAHSKSPRIHQLFALQTDQSIDYKAILVPIDQFSYKIEELFALGFKGMNVTVPFKFAASDLCNSRSERADRAGAVNTMIRTATGWHGDNTDGVGLVKDIVRLTGNLTGKRVLLLGAGGAASGVLHPLLEAGVDQLTLANRNADKANALAVIAQHLRINGCGYDVVPPQAYDIVINATSASLAGDLPPLKPEWFAGALAYDMMYANKPTVFMEQAAVYGASRCEDGLGMLVEQAAEAFYLWRGVHPDTLPVLTLLRAELNAEVSVSKE